MGCVFGRDASAKQVGRKAEASSAEAVRVGRKEDDEEEGSEIKNGGNRKANNENGEEEEAAAAGARRQKRRSSRPNPRLSNPPKHVHGEQVAAGWPPWLSAVAGEAINGWTPRRADTFEKLDKIGQGLVTSRMSCSLYLVFKYMEHDLAGLAASPTIKFTEPQVKCYMHQLLSGLEHCHNQLLAGKPIMPGRTEVEQLHKIFKLCGSPSEEYWKKSKLPHATIFKPQQSYKRCIVETFKDFPPSSLPLIETLLAIDPSERQTASSALRSEFFTTKPYACEPSSLPKYPPSKEMDAKLRDEEARRLRAVGKANAEVKKTRSRDRAVRAMPAPEANAELQANLDRRRLISHANAKSKSEKFPPPHQDGALGYPLGSSHHIDPVFDPPDVPFSSTNFSYPKAHIQTWSGPLVDPAAVGAPRRKKHAAEPEKPVKLYGENL
ncbi:hypothetical protein Q3G72_009114 [Acer saccharum]|nr:hypothetical protein Q3G72_009114 [Acer saccharum]